MLYDSVTQELLISASESNSLDLWNALRVETTKYPQHFLISSGISTPLFNKAILRHRQSLTQNLIEEVSQDFKGKGLPYSWMIPHDSISLHLQGLLAKHGLQPQVEVTSMAIDLACCFLPAQKIDVRIKKVQTLFELRKAGQVLQESFSMAKEHAIPYIKLHERSFLQADTPVHSYIGYLGNEIVGCGSLLEAENIAGIYNIGTIDSARNQGVATSMLVTLLLEAQTKGHSHVVLNAMPQAKKLYRKIGFVELLRYQLYSPVYC